MENETVELVSQNLLAKSLKEALIKEAATAVISTAIAVLGAYLSTRIKNRTDKKNVLVTTTPVEV